MFQSLFESFYLLCREKILHNYLYMPMQEFKRYDAGNLKMRIMDDVDKLGNFIKEQIIDYACGIIMMLALVCLCLLINARMFLCCVGFIPLVLLVDIWIAKGTAKINEKMRVVNGEYYTFEHDSIQFWKEIKMQCAQKRFIEKFKIYRRKLAKLGMVFIRYWLYREIYNDFKANYLNKVLIYIVGAFFVIDGQLSVGNLILFGEYFGILFNEVNQFYNKEVTLKANQPFYRRFYETLQFRPEDEKTKAKPEPLFPIVFEHVSFHYDTGPEIFTDLNLAIEEKEWVALTGASGIGKTTLIRLILGVCSPQAGQITYAGRPANQVNKLELMKKIGLVMQDSLLFNTSIRENLLLANEKATDTQLQKACELADIDAFIEQLPDGFDTVIGEKGVKLSGGQRQRVLLARAFLRDPEFFVFDEATSALDGISEQKIHTSIRNMRSVKTILMVAHRPETAMHADRILTVADKNIKEKKYESRT